MELKIIYIYIWMKKALEVLLIYKYVGVVFFQHKKDKIFKALIEDESF